ncbi:MAG: hypothetical protein AAF561_11910, partial [Planctomycetota bacterium]
PEPFQGLPATPARKEVVVENDIGWRIDAGVDFLFGQPVTIESAATDPERSTLIGDLLRGVIAANGGLAFLQKMALVGSVHGGVDVLVKLLDEADALPACDVANLGATADDGAMAYATVDLARRVRLELVEPARSMPILHEADNRLCVHLQVYRLPRDETSAETPDRAWLSRLFGAGTRVDPQETLVVEAIGPRGWHVYHDGKLVRSGRHPLGRVPVAHVQNIVRPFAWHGAGDVEPLIPLQDELNTRLSDRAYRVALHSMRMYLGVGVDGFLNQKIAPGQMWETDNTEANIIEFGGEAPANPAESPAAPSAVASAISRVRPPFA